MMDRRSLITGLTGFITAPAVVRASVLMPTRAFSLDLTDPLVNSIWWTNSQGHGWGVVNAGYAHWKEYKQPLSKMIEYLHLSPQQRETPGFTLRWS